MPLSSGEDAWGTTSSDCDFDRPSARRRRAAPPLTTATAVPGHPLQRPRLKHAAMVTTIGLLLGSAFVATKVALEALGPLTIVAGRIGLAAVLVSGGCVARRLEIPRVRRLWLVLVGVGVLNTAVPYVLVTWAVQHIDTGLVAILGGTGPLIGLLLSHVLTRDDRLTVAKVTGLILGFAGVIVATGTGSTVRLGTHVLASLAGIGMAASFSLGGVLARRLAEVSPDVVTGVVLGIGAVVMIPVAVAVERPWTFATEWRHVAAVGYLAAMSTALPYVIRFRLIRQVGYTFTSFSGYVIPVVGVGFGALFLGEPITVSMVGALLLVLVGLSVIRVRPTPAPVTNVGSGVGTSHMVDGGGGVSTSAR